MQLRIFIVLLVALAVWNAPCAAEPETPGEKAARVLSEEEEAVISSSETSKGGDYLTLEQCLEIAMEKNFSARRAREEIERAFGVRLEERSAILPQLQSVSEYSKVDEDRLASLDGRTFGTDEAWHATAEIEQPLFLGGEGLARWEKGDLAARAAEYAYRAALNEVMFSVKSRFYAVLLARSQVTVRRESVDLLKRGVEIAKSRLSAGTVAEFNVLRAEVELANALTPLIRVRNELRLSLEELSRVLGLPNQDASEVKLALRIQGEFTYEEPAFDLRAAVEQAFQQRPELKQLKLLRELEEQEIDVERSEYYPKIFAFAGYEWESTRFDDSLSEIDQGWRFGVRARWRMFDSYRTRGKVTQARAEANSARIALQEKRKDIEIEVRRAVSDLLEARELVVASRKVVEQAEEGLRQAAARLQSGAGRQIDVLDTQVALTDARTNAVDALHSFAVARAALSKATAMGLQNAPSAKPDR